MCWPQRTCCFEAGLKSTFATYSGRIQVQFAFGPRHLGRYRFFKKLKRKFTHQVFHYVCEKKLLEPTTSIFLCKQRVRTINLIKTRIRNNVKCVTWVDPKLVQLNKWDRRDETVCVVLSVYWVFGGARLFCVTWFGKYWNEQRPMCGQAAYPRCR
jgi:hypothetical protein